MGGIRVRGRWLLLAGAIAALGVSAPAAHAEQFRFAFGKDVVNDGNACSTVCQSGRAGTGAGELNLPVGTAVYGDELFVADALNYRINVYDFSSGRFKMAFGAQVGGYHVSTCTTQCDRGFSLGCVDAVVPTPQHPCSQIGYYGDSLSAPGALTLVGGHLLVAESMGGRVSEWDAATKTLVRAFGANSGGPDTPQCTSVGACQFPTQGAGAGQLLGPAGVAVAGDEIFVTEATNHRVSVFDLHTGAFERAFGKNVGGFGVDTCIAVCQRATGGSSIGAAGEIDSPSSIAVAGGLAYVAEGFNNRISVFDAASGLFLRAYGTDVGGPGVNSCTSTCFTGGDGHGAGQFGGVSSFALAGGSLFVGEKTTNRVSQLDLVTGRFLRAYGKDVGGPGVNVCTATCGVAAYKEDDVTGEFMPFALSVARGKLLVTTAGTDNRVSKIDLATGGFDLTVGRSVQPGETGEAERCRLECQSGRAGSGAGHLAAPHDLAVGNGQLYVADDFNLRISVFDAATGGFLRAFGHDVGGAGIDTCTTACTTDQLLDGDLGIPGRILRPNAVDVAGNEVFVTDSYANRVSVFDATTGSVLRVFGKDVGGAGVDVCTAGCQVGTAGDAAGELAGPEYALDVDGGKVYVADASSRRVSVFSTAGTFLYAFGDDVGGAGNDICTITCQSGAPGSDAGQLASAYGIGVAGNRAFVTDVFNRRVAEFDATTGAFIRAFGWEVGGPGVDVCTTTCKAGRYQGGGHNAELAQPTRLDVADGEVYVVDIARVVVFDAATGAFLRAFSNGAGGAAEETCTSTCQPVKLSTLGLPKELVSANGVAVSGSTAYVADTGGMRIGVYSRAADAQAPDTQITGGPARFTTDPAPSLTFASSEGGGQLECRLDERKFKPCTSPFAPAALPEGEHVFEARAIDADWNVDPTPARRTFTVDTTPPDTQINSATATSTPTYAFTSGEAAVTFECRLDGAAFNACATPYTAPALALGEHRFEVRAVDAAGNVDPTPDARSVTVEAPKPPVAATPKPPDGFDPIYAGPTGTRSSSDRDSKVTLRYPTSCVHAGQLLRTRLTWTRKQRKGNRFLRVSRVDVLLGGGRLSVDRAAPFTQLVTVPATASPAATVPLEVRAQLKRLHARSITRRIRVSLRVCEVAR